MSSEEKMVTRGRQKKQTSLECLATPLKQKRGRKPHSSSPPPSSPGPLSFFKVLIGDFKDVLFIPPMAACTLKGLAKKYVFIEDVDGKYWNVKMSMVDGSLAFQNGWHDFVSDHSITVGEFILFTYTGGLLFTARIFGTSALERVDFQMKRRKGGCAKERCNTDLIPVNVRIPKRQRISQALEEKHRQSGSEVLRSSKRKRKSVKCGFPKIHVIESDSISEGAIELSSAGEKLHFDSNSKELDITLHDCEQTWHRNSDAAVGELSVISPTELENSDIENIDAVESKGIRNRMCKTEKAAALRNSGGSLPSKQTAEEPDAITKTANCAVQAHSDFKEGSAEMSGSLVQMDKEHDEMRNSGKIEQNHSPELEMLDHEAHDDKMVSLSICKHADCSAKLEFNLIKFEGVAEFFVSADGICHTSLDEKLIEPATGASFNTNGQEEPLCQNDHATFGSKTSVPCETISAVSSNLTLDHTKDKKETLMSISEEYGVPQTKGSSTISESGLQSCNQVHECKCKSYPEIVKGNDWQSGIAHDAFFDEDEKNDTPCSSRRYRVKIDRTDSVDIPSSSVSFSVCLSDDVQSSLEFQKTLASQIGKLKYGRKIVVLQDLLMRCWPVLYHQSKNFVGFIGGWIDFAKANQICRGDVCEFELINKMEPKFRVQITKAEGSIFDEKVA